MASLINVEPLLLKIKNRKLFVMIMPVVFVAMIAGVLVVKPAIGRMKQIQVEESGLAEKEATYKFIVDSEKRLEQMIKRIPVTDDKSQLIEKINELAEKAGFLIISIQPEVEQKIGEHLNCSTLRIEAEGNYHQLGNFVSQVESLESYVKVLTVTIMTDSNPVAASTPAKPGAGGAARARQADYKIGLSLGLLVPAQGVL